MIVTAAFFVSRLLGWVRLIVITNTFGASADRTPTSPPSGARRDLPARGRRRPGLSADPGAGRAVHARRERSRVARRLDRAQLHAAAAGRLLGHRRDLGAGDRAADHARLRHGQHRAHRPPDADHAAVADPAGAGLGCVVGAQRARPLRGGGDRAIHVQPRDHRRGDLPVAVVGRRALAVGVVIGSLLHLLGATAGVVSERFLQLRHRPCRLGRPPVAAADAAAGFRPGRRADPFIVNTALATGIGVGAVTAYNVAFNILQIRSA